MKPINEHNGLRGSLKLSPPPQWRDMPLQALEIGTSINHNKSLFRPGVVVYASNPSSLGG